MPKTRKCQLRIERTFALLPLVLSLLCVGLHGRLCPVHYFRGIQSPCRLLALVPYSVWMMEPILVTGCSLSLRLSLSYTPSLSLSRYLSLSLFKLATVSLSISTIQFRNANAHASVLQNNAPKIMAADSLFGAQNHPHDVNYSLNIFW